MKKISTCPVCETTESINFLKSQNFRINNTKFDIDECVNCGMRFTTPLPSPEEMAKYYDTDNYVSHTGTKKGLVNKLFHTARYFTLRSKFKLLTHYSKGKNHLDIGAGNGVFMEFVQNKNWKTSGVELDDSSRKAIEEKSLEVEKTIYDLENSKTYDVITMWHVLEHIFDLKKDIAHIISKLNKDGVLIVALPNCESYDAEKYKSFWAAYDLPIHLYHFRPTQVKQLFKEFGMEVIAQKPMLFDAFYISLMSEKYKNDNKNSLGVYFRGFYYGLISNLKAENGSYSSQIYIIKKK